MTQPDGVDRIIQQWRTERPDLETGAMAIFGRIFRLAGRGAEATAEAYATFGISRAEFDVLATLRRSGAPYTLSPGALSASMMVSSGGTTARLDRLEKAGLVYRSPDPNDRRGVLVHLTDRGRDVIDQSVGVGLAAQRRLLAHLTPAERHQLDTLLRAALRDA